MAVSNAVGTWIHEYPMTPERVLMALKRETDVRKGDSK
jgi:CO/xanthine dehydrogenase Mo-binding subunit